jgi:UDP-N-acetylmuramoylalanine--D-glutamate ligase
MAASLPRRALVVGAGKTGLAVARFLAARGVHVTVTDKRPMDAASIDGVRWELGGHRAESFTGAELIVLSPGVPEIPELTAARQAGVPVTGEIELASRFIEAPIVGITGTNGKSTVTALCGALAQASGRPAFVGGNLGTPLVEAVGTEAASPSGICVVELSSYQLETVDTFHPRAAAFLNLTPDHLDRYGTMDAYGAAKMNIARNMRRDDVFVMPAGDAAVRAAFDAWSRGRGEGPMVHHFVLGRTRLQTRLAALDAQDFVLVLDGGEERYARSLSHLMGRHNDLNVLAALLLVRASNLVSPEAVRAGLASFRALPHRMQLVAEKSGVRYFDDSKATNVDSVVAGLDGFPVPFSLIAGGRDKGGSYAPLVEALRRASCRGVVTIGEAAPLIERALDGSGIACERGGDMADAVRRARARVGTGEAVVLSPACSSFDMFQNYEHRGAAFLAAAEAQP